MKNAKIEFNLNDHIQIIHKNDTIDIAQETRNPEESKNIEKNINPSKQNFSLIANVNSINTEEKEKIKKKKTFFKTLVDNHKNEVKEKHKQDHLTLFFQKDKIDYSKFSGNQIKLHEINDEHKNKFLFSYSNIENDLQLKKGHLNKIVNESLKRFEIAAFAKIMWALLFFLYYPISIFFICLTLHLIAGLISIILGVLLSLIIFVVPVFILLYCSAKDKQTKDFYYFLISLSWTALLIILRGLYKICKGSILAISKYFLSFVLICKGKINHINDFHENIRVGLGDMRMREVTSLNKLFQNKEAKVLVDL